MIDKPDSNQVVRLVIPFFLRLLMKVERERLGLARKDASVEAGWAPTVWGALERGAKPIDREQWLEALAVLHLSSADIVKLLNAFIDKYPGIWLERSSKNDLEICERPVTSPRVLRSGKVFNIDLNPIRPNLFHELSTYCADPVEIIAFAVDLDCYGPKQVSLPKSATRERVSAIGQDRIDQIIQFIRDLPHEKLGLLERIIDKFERYPASDLARAYEHFSLAVKRK